MYSGKVSLPSSEQLNCNIRKPKIVNIDYVYITGIRSHSGAVVTHSAPTSEINGSHPGPYMGKLVVVYLWLAVYSTEP